MASLAILTMSTLAVLSLTAMSAKVQRQAEASSAALNIARTQIEQLTSVSQSNRSPVTNESLPIPADLGTMMPEGATNVSASYSIKSVSGTKNLQELTVRVSWKNATVGSNGSAWSSVSVSKLVVSFPNMDGVSTDGWTAKTTDQLFYSPPPSPPPSPSEDESDEEPDEEVEANSGGGTTESTPPPPATGFDPGSGAKWM